jgi:hypothetical protein
MRKVLAGCAWVTALTCGAAAWGQTGSLPPQIEAVRWYVNGSLVASGDATTFPTLRLEELDRVRVEADVRLVTEGQGQQQEPVDIRLFYEKISTWVPAFPYVSPEGPTVELDTKEFEFKPLQLARIEAFFYRTAVTFDVPQFNGVNQARLRGLIDYDVGYLVRMRIWNAETATEDDAVPAFFFDMLVVENPALRPPQPPPFADAGADLVTVVSSTVDLDGSDTFDSFNQGFDPTSPDVLEKASLTYTWEELNGPQLVAPTYPDPAVQPWLAQVRLDVIGWYEYRLTVTDGHTALPSLDSMIIQVVSELPANRAPRARITGPTSVAVGTLVSLDGRGSSDPDGDTLNYHWRQTNEVGGPLPPDEIGTLFQPLGGLESSVASWQALSAGAYYFMLIVDDGQLRDKATFTVNVVEVSGARAAAETSSGPSSTGAGQAATPGSVGCGAGLLPLAVLPVLLWLMRGRIR